MACPSPLECAKFFCQLEHQAERTPLCGTELSAKACEDEACPNLHATKDTKPGSFVALFSGSYQMGNILNILKSLPEDLEHLDDVEAKVCSIQNVTRVLVVECDKSLASQFFKHLEGALPGSSSVFVAEDSDDEEEEEDGPEKLEGSLDLQKATHAELLEEVTRLKARVAVLESSDALKEALATINAQKEEIESLKEQLLHSQASRASPRLRSVCMEIVSFLPEALRPFLTTFTAHE